MDGMYVAFTSPTLFSHPFDIHLIPTLYLTRYLFVHLFHLASCIHLFVEPMPASSSSSSSSSSPPPFWSTDPSVLVDPSRLLDAFPMAGQSRNENLNALVRLSVYIAIVLKLVGVPWAVFLLPVVALVLTYVLHRHQRASSGDGSWLDTVYDGVVSSGQALVDTVSTTPAAATSSTTDNSKNTSPDSSPDSSTAEDDPGPVEEGFTLGGDAADTYVSVSTSGAPYTPSPMSPDTSAVFGASCASASSSSSSPSPSCTTPGLRKRKQLAKTKRPLTQCTPPTLDNPFANMMVTDMNDNPTRTPACQATDDPRLPRTLERIFRANGTPDPGDVFQHTSSQRQFFTMPWTTLPNDPKGDFGAWLYDVPPTKKEEGLVFVPGVA